MADEKFMGFVSTDLGGAAFSFGDRGIDLQICASMQGLVNSSSVPTGMVAPGFCYRRMTSPLNTPFKRSRWKF